MKKLLLTGLLFLSFSSLADNSPSQDDRILILGLEVALPTGCEIADVKNKFICTDKFGSEHVIGFEEGAKFESVIKKNYQAAVFDRRVMKTDYGYYVQYIAKKSGRQYSFIYLEKEKLVFFGSDITLVYAFARLYCTNAASRGRSLGR